MSTPHKKLSPLSGRAGEELAQAFLEAHGYLLIDVNVHFGKKSGVTGEIDIVAWEKETLCFIEVKTRQAGGDDNAPAAAVTPAKQRQLTRLATLYALQNGVLEDGETSLRFDVVAILLPQNPQAPPSIALLRGAFDAIYEET